MISLMKMLGVALSSDPVSHERLVPPHADGRRQDAPPSTDVIRRKERSNTLTSVYNASSVCTRSFNITGKQAFERTILGDPSFDNLCQQVADTFGVRVTLNHFGTVVGEFNPRKEPR